jgi:hypothetical protein
MIKKNTDSVIGAGREIRLEVNAEETKYMLMCQQNAGQLIEPLKVCHSSDIWERQ